MKPKRNLIFAVYQWLIAFPILLVLTIITALFTILFSPLLPNSNFSYFPARFWGRAFCKICFVKVKITGLDKLRPDQSYVIILNHQSIFDIFVVYGWLPMFFKWIIKAELRKIPLVGKACEAVGHIFIDRSQPIAAKKSLEKAEKHLQNGVSVVIFPEGTRTHTGELGKFKRGAFRIANDLKLPIVPVTLKGSFDRITRNTYKVTPGIIEMIIHDPIPAYFSFQDENQNLIQKTWDIINDAL
jgi:1-acyl-sn-glycerol-3-phosphate acyltransferase